MFSYRITKYRYLDLDNRLRSGESEWTAFADVGKKVSLEEYLLVESKYLLTLLRVCKSLGVDRLQVSELEDEEEVSGLRDGEWLNWEKIEEVARSVLREQCWCKLRGDVLEVQFGYDFYMYIVSTIDASQALMKWADVSLFVQEFRSTYI